MKIKQHHISIASLVSAVLCPLPFIFLLDEFSREIEFGPQFLGFALASAGTFAYCTILLPILLFFSLVLKRDERLLVDDKWAKRLFIFGLTVCIVYIAIGLVCFQGMYLDNTAFYLASRFAPYFISIVFCLLASIFSISKTSRKISVKQIIPCFSASTYFSGENICRQNYPHRHSVCSRVPGNIRNTCWRSERIGPAF